MTTQTQRVISRDTTSEELNSDYKWGFTIDIEEEAFPKGLNEDVCASDFGQEERAGMDAGVAVESLPVLVSAELH